MKEDKEKQPKNEEKKQSGEVSRRDFLVGAGTVVVGGAIGAGILSGCSGGETVTQTVVQTTTKTVPTTVTTTVGGTGATTVTKTETVGTGGATVTTTKTVTEPGGGVSPALEPEETCCLAVGYGMNMLMDTKNNRIIRSRRMHYDNDPKLTPWSLTARGVTWNAPLKSSCSSMYLAHRARVDSPNRVIYPLKRVDWEPGGDPTKINAQNRGTSNYKRISWDEAASTIASEMKRIADKYGTEALSNVDSSGHPEGNSVPGASGIPGTFLSWWALKQYGTDITTADGAATTSSGGQLGGQYVMGVTYQQEDVLKDIAENCELLLGWGCEPESKTWLGGNGHLNGMWYKWFKKIGIKQVYIMPDVSLGSGRLADKWIPVVPTTDCALMLAIAYIWLQEGTYDQAYLDTHTVGFDKFKPYVTGVEDGIPKTPEWASPICGVTVWTIKALAREWAKKATSIAYGARGGGAVGRTLYGHNPQRIQLYLQCMQGLFGPGKHQFIGMALFGGVTSPVVAVSVGGVAGNSKLSAAKTADGAARPAGYTAQSFPRDYFYNAIFNQPANWYSTGAQFTKLTYPLAGKSEAHFAWGTGGSYTGGRQWGFGIQKGLQSPKWECIVQQSMYLEDGMVFADIVLPVSVIEEKPDIRSSADVVPCLSLRTKPLHPPMGESKSDLECIFIVAEKLGYLSKMNEGKSYDELIQARLKEGYDKSGIAALISRDELAKKTYFLQNAKPDWYDRVPAMRGFYNDPVKNPLRTPSGKLEIESQALLQNMPDDKERPPVAHYIIGGPEADGWSHNDYPYGEKAKTYPLMMVSSTSLWKHHSMNSDIPWTREIEKIIGWDGYAYAPVWINPETAATKGIKDGDIVRVFNDRGGVLGGAVLTERARPGIVRFEQAGGGHAIIPGELHQGGNPNCISSKNTMSKVCYGLAAIDYLCDVEKVTGNMMDEWRKNYPEAFRRNREAYDPARGPYFNGWVEGAK